MSLLLQLCNYHAHTLVQRFVEEEPAVHEQAHASTMDETRVGADVLVDPSWTI